MWLLLVLFVLSDAQVFDVVSRPGFMYAPYTPFVNDSAIRPSVNYSAIEFIMADGVEYGANIIWIGGSNGQFTALSIDERKRLCLEYVNVMKENDTLYPNIYTVFHVSSTRMNEAIELSSYAAQLNALYGLPHSIAILPPYYHRVSTTDSFSQLFAWFKPIISASNGLPMWYYHHPSRSLYDINIYNLLNEAISNDELAQLEGVKFNTNDIGDYFESTNKYHNVTAIVPYFATSLALFAMDGKGFGFGSTEFEIPIIKCMKIAIEENRINDAYWYQAFKTDAAQIYASTVGRRCIYEQLGNGIHLGPPRPPLIPYTQSQCQHIIDTLHNTIDFFNKLQYIKDDINCIPPK